MLGTRIRCQRIIKTYLIFVPLNLLVAYVMNYLSSPVEKWNPSLNKTSLYREYPYPLWYPFDTSLSDGYYWCGFLYQPYAFYFLINGFFCVDWLCICTIIHLTSFVDVLRHAFDSVDKNVDQSLNEDEHLKVKEKRLIICIDQLKDIYECASGLNKVFSSQLLIQELCMTGVVCCCLYRVTSEKEAVEAGYLSSMVAAAFVELFTVSWFNQGFTLEIFRLLPTIYELDWLNYNVKMRKILVFLIARVQKPFYFTMGLGFALDMTVFITMIKTSYSFYALITQSEVRSTQVGQSFDN
ncbi:putative odorant receptor 92a [Euwallacea similis]|uniref:putative odorant receptor 92a n=1 Tax=Euwallacea similis TaxID=1736056 RepID=UPI003450DB45